MRIALIAPPWLPVPSPAYGGTEAVLDTLARGLATAGHDVLLFTTGDATCPVPRAHEFDAAPGVGADASCEVRHVLAAYDLVRGFDLVHDHTVVGPLYAQLLRGPPVITTSHGPFRSGLEPLYRAVSERVPVIAISRSQAATARGVRLAGVIHHGVEPDAFPVGSGAGGYALFLGRMSPDKGVDTAVRVARAAGVPLRIAARMSGPGEWEYFSERVRPLLGRDFEYLGEVGRAEKLALLGQATCLLNPLAWPEPFGMVMVEALACGTPVVATPAGAAGEIVVDGVTGYLRSAPSALARALARVSELDRAACRRRVEECFSSRRMVAEHLAVYRAVIGSGLDGARHADGGLALSR